MGTGLSLGRLSHFEGNGPARAGVAAAAATLLLLLDFGSFLTLAPELDAMVTYREALQFYKNGLSGIIANGDGGVHPPLLDLVSHAAFTLFGQSPLSLRLVAIALVALIAASVERLYARAGDAGKSGGNSDGTGLRAHESIVAAVVTVACPLVATNVFLLMREGLLVAILAPALALFATGGTRCLALASFVLALLPLAKETGVVFLAPFMAYAYCVHGSGSLISKERIARAALVTLPALAVLVAWKAFLKASGGHAWSSWVFTEDKTESPYVTALRAMFQGLGDVYFRQNLANAFLVNFLWVPALLALACVLVALKRRRLAPQAALVLGCALVYAWTVLPFPTWTIPRYAAPLAFLTVAFVCLSLATWTSAARIPALITLAIVFALGKAASIDPVTRAVYGMTTQGGEQIYDTDWNWRGPDRMMVNTQVLQASARVNARLEAIYASDAALVVGDCYGMKIGEKLWSVGLAPSSYQMFPRARALGCVALDKLPAPEVLRNMSVALLLPATLPEGMARALVLIP